MKTQLESITFIYDNDNEKVACFGRDENTKHLRFYELKDMTEKRMQEILAEKSNQ